MKKYRKKPVVIEAVLFDLEVWEDEATLTQRSKSYPMVKSVVLDSEACPIVESLEGSMLVSDGDYIIKGVEGEFYPCKPSIFKASYDEVEVRL